MKNLFVLGIVALLAVAFNTSNVEAGLLKKRCCEPVCCEPVVCCPAPVVVCEPVCCEPAPVCDPCCKTRRTPVKNLLNKLKSRNCCCVVVTCCDATTPAVAPTPTTAPAPTPVEPKTVVMPAPASN